MFSIILWSLDYLVPYTWFLAIRVCIHIAENSITPLCAHVYVAFLKVGRIGGSSSWLESLDSVSGKALRLFCACLEFAGTSI